MRSMWYPLIAALLWLHDGGARNTPPAARGGGGPTAAHAAAPPPTTRFATVIVIGSADPFDWRAPTRSEPFWLLGAIWYQRAFRNVAWVYAPNLESLGPAMKQAVAEIGCSHAERLEFWCHGDSGYFRLERSRYRAATFLQPTPAVASSLHQVRELLAPRAVVHFRSCSTFQGPDGRAFAAAAARFFCASGKYVTIVGCTRPTGLTQPGAHRLRPGDEPDWSIREGAFEAELEGVWIGARDLLRIASGGAYDMLPWLYERVWPIAHERIRAGAARLASLFRGSPSP